MSQEPRSRFDIESTEVVAQTPELVVSVLTLAAGQETPWHYHNVVSDIFYCLEGSLVVETRQPAGRQMLEVGQTCRVEAGRPHRTLGENGGRCRYLLIQGIGPKDTVRLER